ncbi:hypothetical protein [Cupriavidus metallidurans]|uniref:hypothetical protein n=1 Tax=Cupriavidus metallidurans TaxID=119219 RepID=UPI0016443D5A|nr:hypothetical protein [Cupriavidus metallidurans]
MLDITEHFDSREDAQQTASATSEQRCLSFPELMRAAGTPPFCVTVFRNSHGPLTKRYFIGQSGNLEKEVAAQLNEGTAEVHQLFGLIALRDLLGGLEDDQAVCYGLPRRDGTNFRVRSKDRATPEDLTRTKRDMAFAEDSVGVLMLDFDARDGHGFDMSAELDKLFAAVPELFAFQRLVTLSASSNLYVDEECVHAQRGGRCYFLVERATDIPKTGRLIADRLKAAGYVHFHVDTRGGALERTLIDTTVFEENRLDFAAGARCEAPVTQRRPLGIAFTSEPATGKALKPCLSLRDLAPMTATQDQAKKRFVGEAREAVRLLCEERKAAAKESDTDKLVAAGVPREVAAARVERAHEQLTLPREWPLIDDECKQWTVGALIDRPQDFDGRRFRDPLNPNHRGGEACAVAQLVYRPLVIKSFAGGGRTFTLEGDRKKIVLRAGESLRVLADIAAALEGTATFRNSAGGLSFVGPDGSLVPIDKECRRLRQAVLLVADFARYRETDGGRSFREEACDPSLEFFRDFAASPHVENFPIVEIVEDHSLILPDGTTVDRPGYVPEIKALLVDRTGDGLTPINRNASQADAVAAYRRVEGLFAGFFDVDNVARGVTLATALAAVLLPAMAACPATIHTAPSPGTGKTHKAKVIGVLGAGEVPPVFGPNSFKGEEVGKTIAAIARKGMRNVIVDNLPAGSAFGGPEIDAMLSADGGQASRTYGGHEMHAGRNKALVQATVNNGGPTADTVRRSIVCVQDARVARPELLQRGSDPVTDALRNRPQYVADLLTITAAWFNAGCPDVGCGAPLAGFGDWDRLCRRPVAWLGQLGVPVADPLLSQEVAREEDPEAQATMGVLSALELWQRYHDDCEWTPTQVVEAMRDAQEREGYLQRAGEAQSLAGFRSGDGAAGLGLLAALSDALGQGVKSARSVGRHLTGLVKRPTGGLVLTRRMLNGGSLYKVVAVA